MRTKVWSLVVVTALAVVSMACPSSSRLHETEQGGIWLSVTDFDGLPTQVSVNTIVGLGGGILSIEQLIVSSIVTNTSQPTSSLMNVEMEAYEVGFSRADKGTKTPQPTERRIFGTVPPNGTITYDNLPIMTGEEFTNQPLSDLLFVNGAEDRETGSQAILLNLELKFFGRTLNGTRVETQTPARFNIQFVP